MFRTLFFILSFTNLLFGVIILGDQNKVAIIGGNGYVESNNVRKDFKSGEVIYLKKNSHPSNPKKISMGVLNNIYVNLKPDNDKRLICIKYDLIDTKLAEKIKKDLIKLEVKPSKIYMQKVDQKIELFIANIDIETIKTLYPLYYVMALKYFNSKENMKEIPVFAMSVRDVLVYHKATIS